MSPVQNECSDIDTDDFKARPYQDEILKSCIAKNTIVYLPTGAGKTYIAIMALKHFAKDLEKPISEGGKRSIFLTRTRELAYQQHEVIKKRTPLRAAVFTGDLNVDFWLREKWIQELEQYQVITATVDVIFNIVAKEFLKISDINLIVFDECHHARKNSSMFRLLEKCREHNENERPRVIGLTGILTDPSIKPQNIRENLQRIVTISDAKIATAKGEASADVLTYSTCPQESLITYENQTNMYLNYISKQIEKMRETINSYPVDGKQSKTFDKICTRFLDTTNKLGLYGGLVASLAAIVDLELKKRFANTSNTKLLVRSLITSFEMIYHVTEREVYDLMEQQQAYDREVPEISLEMSDDHEQSTILLKSSNQVQKLLIKLHEFIKCTEQPMKGLIFVKTRDTARILYQVIKNYAMTLPNSEINVDFITGLNVKTGTISASVATRNNRIVLEKFKSGEINLIVATDVLEEGIDLQECNLVICFDEPETFASYVQKKGRARMKRSQFCILTAADQEKKEKKKSLQEKIEEWEKNITKLRELVVENDADIVPQETIDITVEQKYNETFTTKEGASVDHFSAIGKLNQYCATLPRDKFTVPVLQWENELIENQNRVRICLPIQSPFKTEIISKLMPHLKLAKRSAAFEAIKQLHAFGELNDSLRSMGWEKDVEKFSKNYCKSWEEFQNDEPGKAGTKKNHRMYEIQTPDALRDSMPQLNEQCYLYEFKIEPHFQVSDSGLEYEENIKIFHKLLQSDRSYGILTMKPLPRMGLMKFYQSFGQINCSVSENPVKITLDNAEKLDKLKRFHCILFRNVLDIRKDFLVYDHKDSVIVVPTENCQIDWSIVENFQSWAKICEKPIYERTNAQYREDEWLHSVVSPWYNTSGNFIVTKISRSETPLTSFPNKEFNNYMGYFETKYPKIDRIIDTDQFLIEVKPVTTKLNRLNPGDGEDGSHNPSKTNWPVYLIPELCHNFRYPGDLWLKAIVLPSALHRISYILHAESLRLSINQYVGLNIADYRPRPLIDAIAKKKSSQERQGRQNSIGDPRPDEIDAKQLASYDMNPFDEDRERLGPECENLFDLERHFDTVLEVDIDYYFKYISISDDSLSDHLNDESLLSNIHSPNQFQKSTPSLCDVEEIDKLRISVLNIKLSTNITRGIEQHEILAAITSASSADVFHNEILEVLGDAFLKFGVSLYLSQQHIDWHEGFLTTIKGQIVGNRNLCYSAIRNKLPGMIKVLKFDPKNDWQPPMLKVADEIQNEMKKKNITPDLLYKLTLSNTELVSGRLNQETLAAYVQMIGNDSDSNAGGEDSLMQNFLGMQRLSDKTCADCVEAILGTCVKTIGIERTFKVLEMFGILPNNDIDISHMLHTELRSPRIRTDILDHEVDYFLANHSMLEQSIGYTFEDRAYLLQALTHPSYPTTRVTGCYQQLEFLGDAVLDFLITLYISERCPNMNPGQLTDLRSALVNNVTLACLCVRYNIHVHMLSQNAVLTESIDRFVKFQEKHKHEVTDHVELLMEEMDVECEMAEYTDVPKTLGDVFEAIIGGIFLDSGNDLEVTWKVIYRLMKKELDKFMADVPIQLVRKLFEYPNANPKFELLSVEEDRISVKLHFCCNGEIMGVQGRGVNRKYAERAAAKLALTKLRENEPSDI